MYKAMIADKRIDQRLQRDEIMMNDTRYLYPLKFDTIFKEKFGEAPR